MKRRGKHSTDDRALDPADTVTPSASVDTRLWRRIADELFPPRVVLLVILFAWYLYSVVDLRLVYPARNILFLWNSRYFTDFLDRPGSLLDWTDHLLVQLCYHGWPCAVVIAATAWLLLVSTIGYMNVVGRARIGGTWIIPVLLLVALYSGYFFPTRGLVGLTLAMAAANTWGRLPISQRSLRFAVYATLSTVLYGVAGEAFYVFALCCAIREALAEQRWLSTLVLVLTAAIVKFGLDAAFAHLSLASDNFRVPAIAEHYGGQWYWWIVLLYAYFPACALLVVSRRWWVGWLLTPWRMLWPPSDGSSSTARSTKRGSHRQTAGSGNRFMPFLRTPRLRWAAITAVVLAPAMLAGYCSLDRERKLVREIDYCAEHGQWNDILEKAKNVPMRAYSKFVNHDVNLALYHTGGLPYQMFSYPQLYEPVMTLEAFSDSDDSALLRKPVDLMLELGRVNEAERFALELVEKNPSGSAFRRLATIKMIKGQCAAASVYLNILRDDLVWSDWARERLQRLAEDPELADDEQVQRTRRLMITEDDLHLSTECYPDGRIALDCRVWLFDLLKKNGRNRMAFEYLMAMNLASGDVAKAIELFPFFEALSYQSIPPLYEQAAIIFATVHPEERKMIGSDIYFRGRKISDATTANFHRLQAIRQQFNKFDDQTQSAAARELRDTYFYYFFFIIRKR